MASTYSHKWVPDNTNKRVNIEIYQGSNLLTVVLYPEGLSLVPADITAYCDSLIAQMEVDRTKNLIQETAAAAADTTYDSNAATLDANKPSSASTVDDATVTAAILADVKEEILAAATASNVNPYSLVPTYQAKYTAAGVSVDLYTIVFEGYGAAMKVSFYNDADGDGTQDGGETTSGLPNGIYMRVWQLSDNAYTDFQMANGKILAYGYETGSHIYSIFLPAGYNLMGGSLAKQITLTDDTINNQGSRGVYDMATPEPLRGGFTAHVFTDADGNGTQDVGEANGFSAGPIICTMSGPLGGRAYLLDGSGNAGVSNDLLPDAGGYIFDIVRPSGYTPTNANALAVPLAGLTVVQNANTNVGNWGIAAS